MKVIICGAGIAGLALAQRLDALGTEVTVVEKAPGPRPQGYMIDFFGPGYDAAEAMGVLPRIRELDHRIEEVTFLDEVGRRRCAIPFALFAKVMGDRMTSIMRPNLERALREHLSDRVEMRYSTSLTRIDNRTDGVTVTLTDGSTQDADLLVGADGIHSTVRNQTFGPERRFLRYLGFHTAAYVFDDPDIHAQVAGRFCITDTINRQLGFYGLHSNRVAVFALHRAPDPTLPVDVPAAIHREYGTLGWLAPRAVAACPPAGQIYYDQVAQIQMPAWNRDRVVLLGDAAYAVSLLAGHGASLAVAGAYLLAEHLARTDAIGTALKRYERALRPLVTDKQQTARHSTRWFLPATTGQLRIRRAALKLARLPLIDRYVAGALAGKPTDIITNLRTGQQQPSPATPLTGTRGGQP